QEEAISVQIVNQYGQMIDQVMEDMSLPIGSMNRKINTRDWASGLYIIQVVSKDQVKALKVLKE
ncbi:MAG: T9SS type A sorting domain-containing protein, partial [Bacteroidota bacterium]